MKKIYLASGNTHKLHELQTALDQAGLPVSVSGPNEIGGMPEVEETGSTFEANSLLKAYGLKKIGPADGWFLAITELRLMLLMGVRCHLCPLCRRVHDKKNNDKVLNEMKDVTDQDVNVVLGACWP